MTGERDPQKQTGRKIRLNEIPPGSFPA